MELLRESAAETWDPWGLESLHGQGRSDMRVSYRWLRKFLNFEISPHDLVQTLTMTGLEVENSLDLGYGGEPIVVAEIAEVLPHPKGGSLSLCRVTTGQGPLRDVVCGAKNFNVGDRAPLALPGARLASGLEVVETAIRGQKSEGMLCSGAELGWNAEASGLLLLPSEEYGVGEPVDFLMEVKVTPNRPDCLSVFGIARDVAAVFNKKVYPPTVRFSESLDHAESFVKVVVRAREQCLRYTGRCLTDVKIGPSPLWLQRKLESGGLRPINNVVDVTNYALLELGHPLHAFDMDKISNNQIVVRLAEEGEKIDLIDGTKAALTPEDLVIADPTKVIALAGIMGSANSEITESTVNVFLESACFDPLTIRRTARRLGLSTDASYRFERGTDRGRLTAPLNMAAYHIKELAGGEVAKGTIEIGSASAHSKPIGLNLTRLNRLLGVELKGREVADILVALGFEILHFDHNTMMVNVPTHRVDISRDVDLVEEVARLYGYGKIPSTAPYLPARPSETDPETRVEDLARNLLTSLGFSETITFSFISQRETERFSWPASRCLALMNPLAQDQAVLRPSLAPSLLSAMQYNLNRGNNDLKFFEVSHVFRAADNESGREEPLTLCAGMCGVWSWHWRSQRREVDFFDMKGVAEHILAALSLPDCEFLADPPPFLHPGRSARMKCEGLEVGWLGELSPGLRDEYDLRARIYLMEMNLSACLTRTSMKRRFERIPKFPAAERDLAVTLDEEIASREVERTIRAHAGDLLESLRLFDFFRGGSVPKGKKSLTYRLVYRAKDRTLTDAEVDAMQKKVVEALGAKLGAALRQ